MIAQLVRIKEEVARQGAGCFKLYLKTALVTR